MDSSEARRLAAERQAAAHALKILKKQMRNRGVKRVEVPRPAPPLALSPFATPQPLAIRPQTAPKATPMPAKGEPMIGYPAGADLGPRRAVVQANFDYLAATTRDEEVIAAVKMFIAALAGCGITNVYVEAPAAAKVLLQMAEPLMGKSPRLFQPIAQPEGAKRIRNSSDEWAAIMLILFCAHIRKRIDGIGLQKALAVAIADIENTIGPNAQIDRLLSTGKRGEPDGDVAAKTTRRLRLAKRLEKDHADLREQDSWIGHQYRQNLEPLESVPVENLLDYTVSVHAAANALRRPLQTDEHKVRPKGGKGRRLED